MKKKNITAKYVKLSSENASTVSKINENDEYLRQSNSNKLPTYLLNLLRTSGLHNSIVSKKVNLLVGEGFSETDVSEKTLDFINQCNPYESLNDILLKCAYDFETFGGYYLKVIYNRASSSISEVYHMPYERSRNDLPNKDDIITEYLYFSDITKEITSYTQKDEFIKYPAFSIKSKKKIQIMYNKSYSPTNRYYATAPYEAALLDIQTYAEISNFNNTTLNNSFAPSYLVFFRGSQPSPEQEDVIMESFIDKYGGTDNNGKPMVFFLDEQQEEPVIKTIDTSDLADQFKTLMQTVKENILESHQFPKQLIGIQESGSLGNSKEILQAGQMFRTDYIIPRQTQILKSFNMLMMYNGLDDLSIVNPNPNIMSYDMTELLLILGRNEVREIFGFEEVEDEIIIDEKNNLDSNE